MKQYKVDKFEFHKLLTGQPIKNLDTWMSENDSFIVKVKYLGEYIFTKEELTENCLVYNDEWYVKRNESKTTD